jgi:hypothetical protein
MSKIIVPLERRFSRVAKDQDSAEHNDYLRPLRGLTNAVLRLLRRPSCSFP